jgi:uncharacterized protein YajQ (UPF0234 family)
MLMFVDFELLTATDISLARANRLFVFFGAAFWVLAISWALLALINPSDETREQGLCYQLPATDYQLLLSCARMATAPSFDVTSTVDLQEVDNALNQARKEVAQRYDFKGSKASIEFDAKESKLVLVADDDFKLNALWEIVQTRLVRRNVPTKNLTRGTVQPAANSTVRQEIALQQGIPTEKARDIVKFIKDSKLKKIQAAIQGDQLRITSPSKDELQEVMRLLRDQDFGVALQFGNYRG